MSILNMNQIYRHANCCWFHAFDPLRDHALTALVFVRAVNAVGHIVTFPRDWYALAGRAHKFVLRTTPFRSCVRNFD